MQNYLSFYQITTHAVDTQKNHLTEATLVSTQTYDVWLIQAQCKLGEHQPDFQIRLHEVKSFFLQPNHNMY